jgi:hypothetical protein
VKPICETCHKQISFERFGGADGSGLCEHCEKVVARRLTAAEQRAGEAEARANTYRLSMMEARNERDVVISDAKMREWEVRVAESYREGRLAGLEEAAGVCDARHDELDQISPATATSCASLMTAGGLAAAIRALMEAPTVTYASRTSSRSTPARPVSQREAPMSDRIAEFRKALTDRLAAHAAYDAACLKLEESRRLGLGGLAQSVRMAECDAALDKYEEAEIEFDRLCHAHADLLVDCMEAVVDMGRATREYARGYGIDKFSFIWAAMRGGRESSPQLKKVEAEFAAARARVAELAARLTEEKSDV